MTPKPISRREAAKLAALYSVPALAGYGVAELTKPAPEPDIRPVLPFSEDQAQALMLPTVPQPKVPNE